VIFAKKFSFKCRLTHTR